MGFRVEKALSYARDATSHQDRMICQRMIQQLGSLGHTPCLQNCAMNGHLQVTVEGHAAMGWFWCL